MKLSELIAVDKDVEITGIVTDSRKVKKGNLFLCLEGEKCDGHAYAKEALERGATVIVSEKKLGIEGEIVLPDTHRAAAALFAAWYGHPEKTLSVIGVTGTNGKTSVTAMLDAIYRKAGVKTALFGTLGTAVDGSFEDGENTTPLPEVLYRKLKEAREKGVGRVVMEVSSHALATHRTAEIHFQKAVYTNLTQDHLDYHKTMQSYASTKLMLFRQCDCGIFNYDDPYSYYASQISLCDGYGYGQKQGCDFRVEEVLKNALSSVEYTFLHRGKRYRVACPVFGEFHIYNTLAAVSTAMLDGVDFDIIESALADFHGVKGRCETLYDGAFTVMIDYAHTPDALFSVLSVLRTHIPNGKGRLRVLFGCGGDRDRTKRPMMGHIAALLADEVIVTSDNPRSEEKSAIIADIVGGMDDLNSDNQPKVIEDRREALQYAIDSSLEGDVLLVAGKGHEEYEIDRYGRRPFSERQILRARLQKNGYLS